MGDKAKQVDECKPAGKSESISLLPQRLHTSVHAIQVPALHSTPWASAHAVGFKGGDKVEQIEACMPSSRAIGEQAYWAPSVCCRTCALQHASDSGTCTAQLDLSPRVHTTCHVVGLCGVCQHARRGHCPSVAAAIARQRACGAGTCTAQDCMI